MPLFQLENGVMSSCENRNGNKKTDELKKLNQSSTVHTRLSSCAKNVTGENLHLSSALSELNFKHKKQTGSKLLGQNQRHSISNDSSN